MLLRGWLVLLFLSFDTASACTVFLVGKDATVDGSVLVSHSNDGEFETDPRLVKVPSANHPPNSPRDVFFSPETYPRYVGFARGDIPEYAPKSGQQKPFVPIGNISQVNHTFAHLEETYGAVNEQQVVKARARASLVPSRSQWHGSLGIDELTHVAMERSSSAKDAIVLMGSLAPKRTAYGAGEFEGTAESLGVTDP